MSDTSLGLEIISNPGGWGLVYVVGMMSCASKRICSMPTLHTFSLSTCKVSHLWTPVPSVTFGNSCSICHICQLLDVLQAEEAEAMQSLWESLSQPASRQGSPLSMLPAWHFDPDIIPQYEAPEPPAVPGPSSSQSLDVPGYSSAIHLDIQTWPKFPSVEALAIVASMLASDHVVCWPE